MVEFKFRTKKPSGRCIGFSDISCWSNNVLYTELLGLAHREFLGTVDFLICFSGMCAEVGDAIYDIELKTPQMVLLREEKSYRRKLFMDPPLNANTGVAVLAMIGGMPIIGVSEYGDTALYSTRRAYRLRLWNVLDKFGKKAMYFLENRQFESREYTHWKLYYLQMHIDDLIDAMRIVNMILTSDGRIKRTARLVVEDEGNVFIDVYSGQTMLVRIGLHEYEDTLLANIYNTSSTKPMPGIEYDLKFLGAKFRRHGEMIVKALHGLSNL